MKKLLAIVFFGTFLVASTTPMVSTLLGFGNATAVAQDNDDSQGDNDLQGDNGQ